MLFLAVRHSTVRHSAGDRNSEQCCFLRSVTQQEIGTVNSAASHSVLILLELAGLSPSGLAGLIQS